MPFNIYEIKNVGFLNKGAELMLVAIFQELLKIDRSAMLALQPSASSPYDKRMGYSAYQKVGGFRKGMDWSWLAEMIPGHIKKNWGLVTDKNLTGVLDASGFAYGDSWSPKWLSYSVKQAKKIKRNNGYYILMPQAFGIFHDRYSIGKIRDLVDAAAIVFARDERSRLNLEQAGVDMKKVYVYPDFTATVSMLKTDLPATDYACIVPNSKLTSKMNKDGFSKDNYIDFLCQCIEHLMKIGINPYFVFHHTQDDRVIFNRVNTKLNRPVEVINESDARKLKYILGNARINICSRYHACVSALSQCVPTLSVGWSHKYEMLYEDYGVDKLVIVDYVKPGEIIDQTLFDHDHLKSVLSRSTVNVKKRIAEMWMLIAEHIQPKVANSHDAISI